ncbi:MAG TPA: response regulator [Polyangia bacterium]|nr:response regulator [Polyangia bacterium]
MSHARADCPGILLVEDDLDLLNIERQLLADEGYPVKPAANGYEALAILRGPETEPLPCLILLDLMMPVMDGWQFRDEQVRDPRLASIPVVILTANGQALGKRDRLSVAAALTKPVALKQLLDIVESFCGAPPDSSV